MPALENHGGVRFLFCSHAATGSAWVYVFKGDGEARFCLTPVRLEYTMRWSPTEQRKVRRILNQIPEKGHLGDAMQQSEIAPIEAETVAFRDDCIVVYLSDGRTISTPVAWYAELFDQNDEELAKCEVSGAGSHLLWPTLNIGIPTRWIVEGRRG